MPAGHQPLVGGRRKLDAEPRQGRGAGPEGAPYPPHPPRSLRWALTPPGARVPRCLRAAQGEAAGLTECPAEVLVHHGADVPLEVGEEDTAGADVLGLGGSLLLGAAVLLLDAGRGVAGEGAAGAGAAAALRGFLHFGVKGEFLQGRKENRAGHAAHQGALARPVPSGVQRRSLPRSSRGDAKVCSSAARRSLSIHHNPHTPISPSQVRGQRKDCR